MEQVENKVKFDFQSLDQGGKTIVEYVWLGGTGSDLRCKAKTYDGPITKVEELDEWNYDGSSTWQAPTESSEVLLRPVALFNDPFRGAPNKIAMCETYHVDGTPTVTNFRHFASKIFEKQGKHEPWFGIEQEYAIMVPLGTGVTWPLGWPLGGYPKPQGSYYCSVGTRFNKGREVMEAHYKACLNAGIKIYGTNCEVMPGQWEFQVGTCNGIEVGDHLWMARYLLQRVGEIYGVEISIDPKPIKGDWNGSGCHTNYSTTETRNDDNLKTIHSHMEKLSESHEAMIALYGEDNHHRLTGKHETSSMEKFSFGVANRGCSVRIPRTTDNKKQGYYEDRRPAANIDPYVVSAAIFSVTCLDKFGLEELSKHYQNFKAKRQEISISFL
jgi:glutamine synthetase